MRPKRHWAVFLVAGAAALFVAGEGLAVLGDIVFERPGGAEGFPAAMFPHWVHRIRYRCYVCHPAIFEMERGAAEITMESIMQEEFCGECHNGRIAFGPEFEACNRCHVEPAN